MSARLRIFRGAIIAAAAMAGLVGAHLLDYVVLYHDAIARSGLLQRTGHGYFGRAVEFAIASAVVAAIASGAFGFWRAHARAIEPRWSRRSMLALALIQSGAFVLLEAAERVVAHATAQQFLKVTLLGVLLQVVVAAIATAVLALLERAGEVLARAIRHAPPARRISLGWRAPEDPLPFGICHLLRAPPRAPPIALSV